MFSSFQKGNRHGATLAEKLDRMSMPEPMSGCTLWLGSVGNSGYGQLWDMVGRRKILGAHVAAWEIKNGPLTEGMEIDHLCRVRTCINPDHLEAVPHIENLRRAPTCISTRNAAKTACPRGHEYSHVSKRGYRYCRKCETETMRRRAAAKKAEANVVPGT